MISEFFREVLRFIILVLLRPIARAVGTIVSPVYDIAFGPLGERSQRKRERRFQDEIRRSLPWLFARYEAKVIPNTQSYPRAFDYAVVTIALGNILIRFVSGRGELRADIAPAHAPTNWEEIGEAIAFVGESKQSPPRYFRLADLGQLLEQNLNRLNPAFAQGQYEQSDRSSTVPRLIRL
jgi:hypothetical protein